MECVVCNSEMRRHFCNDGHWIAACPTCGHQSVDSIAATGHVERVYTDAYFFGGGAGYPDYLRESELLQAHGRRCGRYLKRFGEPGTLLDVGSAAGFVLRGLVDTGWLGRGIEPNVTMAKHARDELQLNVIASDFESFCPPCQFDAVTMIQVIAHFVDPRLALETSAKITRPGGLLLVETWDRRSWTARLLGKGWHEYSPPSVLHWFSKDGMARVAGACGYRELGRCRPFKWIKGAHAKSLLSHKLGGSAIGRLALTPARLIPDSLPIFYPSEDLFWMAFRRE